MWLAQAAVLPYSAERLGGHLTKLDDSETVNFHFPVPQESQFPISTNADAPISIFAISIFHFLITIYHITQ